MMPSSTSAARERLARAAALIAEIPGHPRPGVLFRDIMPMLADAEALAAVTDAMIEPFEGRFDAVAGIEARGFLLAGAVAIRSGAGLVPVRKAGRLPRPAAAIPFSLEYGEATIEVQADVPRGARVLLVDDVLATGGTLAAAEALLGRIGASIAGVSVLMELPELRGRAQLPELPVHVVLAARPEGER